MSTLSKKEIEQPDRFVQIMTACMDYMRTHEKKIMIGLMVVVLVLVAAVGWYMYDNKKEAEAMKLYNAAFAKAVGMNAATPTKPEDVLKAYEEVIGKHKGTNAAEIASYQVANIYLRVGEIDKAIQYLNVFVKEASSRSPLLRYAYSSLGYCHEAKKDYTKALEMFQKAVQGKDKSAFNGNVYYEMAGIYELQNKKADALKYYKMALEQDPESTLGALIKRKIAELS